MSRWAACLVASAAVFAAASLWPAPASAAARLPATNVINGEQAAPGSFPYLAFVYFREGTTGEACSGTVVSSNVILTAAHCVVDEEHDVLRAAAGFRVVTGNVDWTATERVVSTVTAVAVFPEYTWSGSYSHWGDAALLQLSSPISAPPVRLASGESWNPGSAAVMAGWGKVTASQSGPSAVLHYGTTAVQSPAYCASKATYFHSAGQLCVLDALDHSSSACNGDSGGPLLVVAPGTASEPLEIGIASFVVNSSCAATSPQYYTRADLVYSWVAAQIGIAAPPPPPAPAPAAPPVPSAAAKPTLPALGDGAAKGLVRAALSAGLGGRFQRRTGFRASCEAIEASKRTCEVLWRGGRFQYAGWVTVFYALEGDQVVSRSSYRVKRTPVACGPRRCPSRVFRS